MVFYQPTPARHIFDAIGRLSLDHSDVLVDLGSGLGHVPLLAGICSKARCVGIELEAAYVACARQCAKALNLANVSFIQQDVRSADFTDGTVFYLYTPFTGTMLRTVLERLRQEAAKRPIRVCTLGPCTLEVANEVWLRPIGGLYADQVAVFSSTQT
jgi:predicted RNA methylase